MTPRPRTSSARVERGDWQTPLVLARKVALLTRQLFAFPKVVLEPTCGRGVFLLAAAEAYPESQLRGYDIDSGYIDEAKAALESTQAELFVGDFFSLGWEEHLACLPDPILVLGNPPWVTSAGIGAIGGVNVPPKTNFKQACGLDARTGKSNFDVSEWMILRLLALLRQRSFCMAMLCKASVARRVMEHAAKNGWVIFGATYRIDAKQHFDAAVNAVLLVVSDAPFLGDRTRGWPVFDSLDAAAPARVMDVVNFRATSDIERFASTQYLEGECVPTWRSGVKHDCATVMELERRADTLCNGLGEAVSVEDDLVFPLLKGSDVANSRPPGKRFVLVPQRALGEDTTPLREVAPKAWEYLEKHRPELDARKSSIYKGRPPFAMFGIGKYSFCPYKIAICGLYKRIRFSFVEPYEGRPVLLDDTCYFLPFDDRDEAQEAYQALCGDLARSFFEARVFWDEKRPIGKTLLQSLALDTLVRASA